MSNFKVGDWVTISKGKPWKATEFDFFHLKLDNDVELWQPKEGEWCWFWDIKDKTPSIGQFEKYHNGYYYSSAFNGSICEFCEPFIGELPSFLKDK